MEIRHLKYFIAIAEEGKILQAAQRLNMAQPPLSKQLMMLESELGVKLFERHPRKLVITEEGKLLYQRAKEILEFIDGSIEEVKELANGTRGTLSIGTIASLGAELLPSRVREFRQQYPNICFQVWEGDPNRIMELVENRVVELGIVRLPVDNRLFEMLSLPEEPFVAAMSPHWNIGGDRPFIRLSELKDKPLMLLRRQKGTSDYYNHPLYTSDIVGTACLQNGFEPKIICESSDLTTLLNWASHDIGITIVPRSAMKLMPFSNLVFKEIREPVIMTRPPVLIWLKRRYLSSISRKFIEYLPVSAQTPGPHPDAKGESA